MKASLSSRKKNAGLDHVIGHAVSAARILCLLLVVGMVSCEQDVASVDVDDRGGQNFAVNQSEWHDYKRLDFVIDGRPAILIVPDKPAEGNPWIWRAEWFGDQHGPQVQLELLARGWHVAYMNAKDMFGAPPAMDLFDSYYDHVVSEYRLSEQLVMEGFSRGGLYAVNFATSYPERIRALYLDAPALDLHSWPGRKHSGWTTFLDSYDIQDVDSEIDAINPINKISSLIDLEIPVIGVSGDADKIVPLNENLQVLAFAYQQTDVPFQLIIKEGSGHSPHSLQDPKPIVDFILDQ